MDSSPPEKSGLFKAKNARQGDLRDTIKTLVIAVIFALIFRSFAFEPFHIPSDSMKSNLLVGDYLFVTKFSYGYSRYSLPFFGFPNVHGRFLEMHAPQRGDVVVFRPPGQPSEDFIKRLIGLPGDHIRMKGGVLYINGEMAKKEYVEEWTDQEPDQAHYPITYKRYRETLPDGKSYFILNTQTPSEVEDTGEFVVPEGHYFMMGDNRDRSRDSRYLEHGDDVVGYVPAENFVGRADLILFSWRDWFSFRGDRFFNRIP